MRYHFDMVSAGRIAVDHEGDDMINPSEVQRQADLILLDAAQHDAGAGNDITVRVRDAQGQALYEVSMVLVRRWLPRGR